MTWRATTAIRARRQRLGLSQTRLAKMIGVSKSLLSHIEAGSRHPTQQQVAKIADALAMPVDLLVLGLGRMPTDIADALEKNPAEVAAAIRSKVEAKAVSYPTSPKATAQPRPRLVRHSASQLPERIDANKSSTSYRAHSYHTKVPPDAIRPFIRAFTKPGELVFDPFCGSGMTGVAALMEGRDALLSDLSPAAVHIARNYTAPCDPAAFSDALKRIERACAPTMRWLYRPLRSEIVVEYTTWSDIYRCPACHQGVLYWDVMHKGGADGNRFFCPSCGAASRKANSQWLGEQPVQSHYSLGSTRIHSHPPTSEELALIEEADATPIPYWTPTVPFGPDREMWRASHEAMGIGEVSGFFTKRNLHALAALRHVIAAECDIRIREAFMFAFTATVNRASKRYQWNAKRPTNVMTGTLYISSLRYEWNVWSLFKRKASDVLRYYQAFPVSKSRVEVFQRSATQLDCLPDRSVDMVFMDPPFGSNIFYADSSLLWDAWLGELTDPTHEIVVNKHRRSSGGGKGLPEYAELMTRSFEEAARVLKKGGRAVLAFSNSDDRVWQSVEAALQQAGFEADTAHILNKGQPSIKGVKGRLGQEKVTTLDLLLCLKHKKSGKQLTASFSPPGDFIDGAIREHLARSAGRPQLIDEIYSAVIRAAIEASYSVAGITMSTIAERCRKLGANGRGHRWMLPATQKKRSLKASFFAGYLADPSTLPTSSNASTVIKPLGSVRVPGGRNSAFYLAHSYHTKVPPEAIAPFIEHYTKPGDVVLDPFCGSGMAGVAAALSGRKAILSDLSPAAIHLAWNHTRPCDPDRLDEGFRRIENALGPIFDELYGTTLADGGHGKIHWTLWSTVHRCPACRSEFKLWEAMDKDNGRLGASINCPRCHLTISRSRLETMGSQPAWIAYEAGRGRRSEKEPSTQDIKRALSFKRSSIDTWFPTTPLAADREMYIRCALQLQGVKSIADFYTARNLQALSLIWREIMGVDDDRIRRALAFAFTNTAWHGTRMRRFNARGGQRPLTGTLYIPQLSIEANVLEIMANKIAQLKRYFQSFRPLASEPPALLLSNAADLAHVGDATVDYVFTDPPFGSNIFYADCNLIWESWLGTLTDVSAEAVVNRSLSIEKGGKSLEFYSRVMAASMKEIARVLKPAGWATVVFHNTDAAVWQAIRDAAAQAGFEFHEAASLDRKQQSHKGYKGRSGAEDVAHFDVVFNLQKPSQIKRSGARTRAKRIDFHKLVWQVASSQEYAQRGLQGVHAEVMRRLASEGHENFVDYALIRRIWEAMEKPQAAE